MSRSNQTKEHTDHKAARARAEKERRRKGMKHAVRVRTVNTLYIVLTFLIILAGVAVMIVFEWLGWFEGLFGAILCVAVAGFTVMCVFDEAMLLTDCVTVADGQANAGKNAKGELMIFHTRNIERIELRDKQGNTVPENRKSYWGVCVTFVMVSGRVNQRARGYIRQKTLDRLRAVCASSQEPEQTE